MAMFFGVISPIIRRMRVINIIEKSSAVSGKRRVPKPSESVVAKMFTNMFPISMVTKSSSGTVKKIFTNRFVFPFALLRSRSRSKLFKEKKAVSEPEKKAERRRRIGKIIIRIRRLASIPT